MLSIWPKRSQKFFFSQIILRNTQHKTIIYFSLLLSWVTVFFKEWWGNNATGKKDLIFIWEIAYSQAVWARGSTRMCTMYRLVCILGQFLQPCIDLFPDDYRKIPVSTALPNSKNERKNFTINYSKCLHYTVSPRLCMLNSSKLIRNVLIRTQEEAEMKASLI